MGNWTVLWQKSELGFQRNNLRKIWKLKTVLFVKKCNFLKNGSLAELWGVVTDSSNCRANIQKPFSLENVRKKQPRNKQWHWRTVPFLFFFYVCLSSSGLLIIGKSAAVCKVWSGRSGEQTLYIYRMLLLAADATVDPGSSGVKPGWGGGGGGATGPVYTHIRKYYRVNKLLHLF